MRMKRRIRTDVCLILCGVLVWFLADARQLRLEAVKALTLCAGTVIPALFPFMVVTGLLVRLGFGQWLAPDMAGLMASLFRLPGCAGSALLLGLVGGYPIGARTAAELYASGDLTRQEAERLLTFCNNSNPVFLISVLGAGVFGSVRTGLWLWLIHVCAALFTGLLFRGLGRGRKTVPPAISFQAPSLPAAFVSSVRDSAGTMLSVCAFVTFFYVLISPLTALPGPWAALAVGCGAVFLAVAGPALIRPIKQNCHAIGGKADEDCRQAFVCPHDICGMLQRACQVLQQLRQAASKRLCQQEGEPDDGDYANEIKQGKLVRRLPRFIFLLFFHVGSSHSKSCCSVR